MPVYSDEQLQGIPFAPSAPTLPMQVPGGTPEEAAKAQQELTKSTAAATQSRSYDLWDHAQDLAGSLSNLEDLLNKGKGRNIYGQNLPGQLIGHGGGGIARTVRQSEIATGFGNPEDAQKDEILADATDSAITDAALKRQAYARVSRGGGGAGSGDQGGPEASGNAPRNSIAMIRDMIGSRATSTLPGLQAKVHESWNDVFDGMGRANQADPQTYPTSQAIKILQPYGWRPNEIIDGLKARRNPRELPGAGGAVESNKPGATAPAASPLPGQGADHGDQPGEQPAPSNPPGRLKPGIQAGFGTTGQRTGDVTNRLNMERMEPQVQVPEMPKQFNPARAFQYERAVQVLQQHPELADNGEWDKRFAPNFPGTAKQLLRKMQVQGAGQ